MMRSSIVLTPILLLVSAAAVAPSGQLNVNGQKRTRTCAAMKGATVPLRFADGTPTGFFVRADDPSMEGKNARDCPAGSMELDAQEIITTADGMQLMFHPGGGPGHYKDHIENGQYGHVAVSDLKSPPPQPNPQNLNGKPAPLDAGREYFIEPTRIPPDMFYKDNANDEGRTGSTYYTYGNPGYDKTGGRGDWTYINWSWVQNGAGPQHPQNKTSGGGIVRAIAKRDMLFDACDVEAIVGYSYGRDNKLNGRVTAFYGKTFAGPGEKGTVIYGWIPHSFQKNGDIIVPCVRRSDAHALSPSIVGGTHRPDDRMERMARNLLTEVVTDSSRQAMVATDFSAERDPQMRMELITELSRMDDADSIRSMLRLLGEEKDARVREQIEVVLGFMRTTPHEMKEVCPAMLTAFTRSTDPSERLRLLDVVSNIPDAEAVQFIAAAGGDARGDEEHFAVADALFKLSPRTNVPPAIITKVIDDLKMRAKASADAGVRLRALHLLAAPGRNQQSFLAEMLASEKAPKVREFLAKVTRN